MLALAVTAAFSAVALKKYAPETSVVIAVGASAALLISLLGMISPVTQEITDLISGSDIAPEYASALLKTIGICFVCQFTSDACRDAGQTSLASKVELISKASVLIISLPLFRNILSSVTTLLRGG